MIYIDVDNQQPLTFLPMQIGSVEDQWHCTFPVFLIFIYASSVCHFEAYVPLIYDNSLVILFKVKEFCKIYHRKKEKREKQ